MNVLFILAADNQSCFYLLSLKKQEKTLLRLGPEQVLAGEKLGEVYATFGAKQKEFCHWLANALAGTIDHYVVLTEENLRAFLFAKQETIEVRNPQAFTYHGQAQETASNTDPKNCEEAFPKGPQSLDSAAFLRFITYQEDAPGVFGVFARQEHVLRLIKEALLTSANPVTITKHFRHFIRLVTTDLNLGDCLRLVGKYQETKGQKLRRLTLAEWTAPHSLTEA